tara:strand:+ start:143 stop:712 length:570 start_codon:yes stop_codon:yes gene_type:complete
LGQLCQGLRFLRELNLEDTNVSAGALSQIADGCRYLTALRLAFTQANDGVVMRLAQSCPYLTEMDLSGCPHLSPWGLNSALARMPDLRALSLSNDLQFESHGIVHPKLEVLNLSFCKNLTDEGLIRTARSCPRLLAIDLSWCSGLTLEGVNGLFLTIPQLKCVNVRGLLALLPGRFVAEMESRGISILS